MAPRHREKPDYMLRGGVHGHRVSSLVGALLFLLGCVLFLYPVIEGILAQREANDTIGQALSTDVQEGEGSSSGKRSKDGDPAYDYLMRYNRSVIDGTAGPINDPWGIGSDQATLRDIGLADGMVGSISIDRLGETIPLYLGASRDILAKGAGVIAGTSAPLGGVGNNCVIAAHRAAWSGLPMFRDIEDIQLGDFVVIDTPWDTLVYRVVETKVITPTDIGALAPQEGRDLVTLFTCHPYRHNYQRYLVYCEREEGYETPQETTGSMGPLQAIGQAALPSQSPELTIERWVRVAGMLLLLAIAIAWLVAGLGRLSDKVRNGCRAD